MLDDLTGPRQECGEEVAEAHQVDERSESLHGKQDNQSDVTEELEPRPGEHSGAPEIVFLEQGIPTECIGSVSAPKTFWSNHTIKVGISCEKGCSWVYLTDEQHSHGGKSHQELRKCPGCGQYLL